MITGEFRVCDLMFTFRRVLDCLWSVFSVSQCRGDWTPEASDLRYAVLGSFDGNIQDISSSKAAMFALDNQGRFRAWGNGSGGILGVGSTETSLLSWTTDVQGCSYSYMYSASWIMRYSGDNLPTPFLASGLKATEIRATDDNVACVLLENGRIK